MELRVFIAGDRSLVESFSGNNFEKFSKEIDSVVDKIGSFKCFGNGDRLLIAIKRDPDLKEFNKLAMRYAEEHNLSIVEYLSVRNFDGRPDLVGTRNSLIVSEVNRAVIFKHEGSPAIMNLIDAFDKVNYKLSVKNS